MKRLGIRLFKGTLFSVMLIVMIASSLVRAENSVRIPRGDLVVDLGNEGRLSLLALGDREARLSGESRDQLILARATDACVGLGYLGHSQSKKALVSVSHEKTFNIQANAAVKAGYAEVFEELHCLIPDNAVKIDKRSRR